MHEIKVGKNDAGQRLDKFITKALHLPMSLLYKSIRCKKIKVNRKRAEVGTILAEGDTVQCFLPEEFFTKKTDETSFSRIKPNLRVVYEDENILLINKPAGVVVHEDDEGATDTLIAHIKAYLYQKGEYRPDEELSFAPALCNRIDRGTEGIVIAAKNAEALRILNEKIKNREIDKFYLCAVNGIPREKEALLTGYLLKNESTKTVRIYDKNPPRAAKPIKTKYRVLAEREDTALLEVELLTGRTHQIRAHLAHIGHSLLGDGKYGRLREDARSGYRHQALASYRLRFSFVGEKTALDYLNGREFSIPKNEISFVKPYFKR